MLAQLVRGSSPQIQFQGRLAVDCCVCSFGPDSRINESAGTRTQDLRLKRPLLYQAELHSQVISFDYIALSDFLVNKNVDLAGFQYVLFITSRIM